MRQHIVSEPKAKAGPSEAREAITHYEKALQFQPDFAAAHYNYGLALAKCGRIDEALTQFQKALGLAERQNDQGLAIEVIAKMRLLQTGSSSRKRPSIPTPSAAQPEQLPQ